jgi:hypothetical protein
VFAAWNVSSWPVTPLSSFSAFPVLEKADMAADLAEPYRMTQCGCRERFARSRALLRKHARIKKNGRVELEKGWSDRKIAKKAKSETSLVRRLRGDLYGRIRVEVVREPRVPRSRLTRASFKWSELQIKDRAR